MDSEKKEFTNWWALGIGLLLVTIVLFTILGYARVYSRTVVERKVFENSYQYKSGQRTKEAVYEAQLEEIRHKLSRSDLNNVQRNNLEAQESMIRIQLSASRKEKR